MSRVHDLARFASDFGARAFLDLMLQKVNRPAVHQVRIRGIPTPVAFRPGTIDLTIMRQIFLVRECIIELEKTPRVIVDGGAHVGYSSLLFANTYPDARVIAVEPESSNAEVFRLNCRDYSRIELVPGALWPRRERLDILNRNALHDGFFVGPTDASDGVSAVTIPDLLERAGGGPIDILKLDIEGAEKELFEIGADAWLPHVRVLMVELHDRKKEGCTKAVFKAVEHRARRIHTRGEYTIFHLDT